MNQRLTVSGTLLAVLTAAIGIGWNSVQPPPRTGDVPYVPTRQPVVDRMLQLAGVSAADLVYDLGSGDGRIVVRAAAAYGARGVGYEIDPSLVAQSRRNAAAAGVAELAEFREADLFAADLRPASVVTLYLLPSVNLALRPRLLAQLTPGTPVVSQTFDMAEWEPDARDTVEGLDPPAELYRWVVPDAFGGSWSIRFDDDVSTMTLKLWQSFQKVEGWLATEGGEMPVVGRIDGSSIRVEAVRAMGDGSRLVLRGTVSGGRWEGDATVAASRHRFTAQRTAAAIEGTWRIDADDTTVRIERRQDGWGAARGAAGERPMTDFYVWGASVYWVFGGGEGEAPRIIYSGRVEGDAIAGNRTDGTRLRPWTARRER